MIHTKRTVTIGNLESIIDKPIVLYRGDREVEVEFTLIGSDFTFSNRGEVIESMNATHGQLVINTPTGEHMFSEIAECDEGGVIFIITKEMIDELIEIGFYSFQIRLFDESQVSRVTIPPVTQGIEIRNPIAAEDETNVVDVGLVDYSRIGRDQLNEEMPTFDWAGNYIKTNWVEHDIITENKMNKIEDGIWTINNKISESDNVFLKKAEQMEVQRQNDVNSLNAKDTQLSNDIQTVNRNLTNEVNKLRVDMEVGDAGVKNEFDSQLKDIVVNVRSFGAKGDGSTDDTQAILNAIDYVQDTKCLYFPPGTYKISSDIHMPKKVESRGSISGAKLIFAQKKDLYVKGLACDDVLFSGVWRGDISIIYATNIYIDGNIDWYGTYWNNFYIKQCLGVLEIDIEKGAVNQNRFQGGRVREIRIQGTNQTYSTSQAHNNYFTNMDISGGGAIQTDSRMERNYLVNIYCESGGVIRGNWCIDGFTGDIKPNPTMENNILNSNNAIPRTSHDFLSMTTGNLAIGGEWDDLNVNGVPKCIQANNATSTVVSDNTSPDMSNKSVQIVSNNVTWANFDINLKKAFNGFGGATFYAKGNIKAIEILREDNYIYADYHTSVDVGNDWKLYRITLPNNANVNKIRCYLTTSSAEVNTIYISGIKALPYKIATLPLESNNRIKGYVSRKPTTGIWNNGDVILNSNITENGEAGWICKDASTLDFVGIQSTINKLKQEKFFEKTTTSTDKTLFKVTCSAYYEYATIEMTIHYYLKSSSSNEYKGFAGIGKYIIALTKEGTLIKQTVNPLSEIYQGLSGGGITNSLEITNSNGYWNINITNNYSVTCTCELQYKTLSSTNLVI